jgi:protein SCO1/2
VIRGRRSGAPALLLPALFLAACGGGSAKDAVQGTTTPAAVVSSSAPQTTALEPGEFAGPLAALRGKAVYVTFVYSHCPDTCPLMMQALGAAKRKMKDPGSMQIVAVSVDPKGDTPAAVKKFLADRSLTGKVRWLLGTRAQLRPVWRAYNILPKSVPETPAIIEHLSLIYGVDARGKIRVGYPAAPLDPAWIEHDAPILAGAE